MDYDLELRRNLGKLSLALAIVNAGRAGVRSRWKLLLRVQHHIHGSKCSSKSFQTVCGERTYFLLE